MDKVERFQNAYDYLYGRGEYHSKSELAKRLGRTRTNVSEAYYGRQPYFTDKFLLSFCREFPIINYEWLVNGTGEMLNQKEKPSEEIHTWADTFIKILSKQVAENEALNRQLKEEISEVRTLRSELQQAVQAFRMAQKHKVVPYTPCTTTYEQAAEPE